MDTHDPIPRSSTQWSRLAAKDLEYVFERYHVVIRNEVRRRVGADADLAEEIAAHVRERLIDQVAEGKLTRDTVKKRLRDVVRAMCVNEAKNYFRALARRRQREQIAGAEWAARTPTDDRAWEDDCRTGLLGVVAEVVRAVLEQVTRQGVRGRSARAVLDYILANPATHGEAKGTEVAARLADLDPDGKWTAGKYANTIGTVRVKVGEEFVRRATLEVGEGATRAEVEEELAADGVLTFCREHAADLLEALP